MSEPEPADDGAPSDEVMLREAPGEGRADDWALVLHATGIPHRVERADDRWLIFVGEADVAAAEAALVAYERERDPPSSLQVEAPPVAYARSQLGLIVGVALLALHLLRYVFERRGRFVDAGAVDAARVLGGEAWRTVTALTLHGDIAHVLANAAAGALLITAVARAVGPGVGGLLVLVTGALGNLATALVYQHDHRAIGASTAIFGALGLLGALQLVGRRQQAPRRRRLWTVVAALVLLFGLESSGPNTDVLAHLFGLVAGIVVGLPVALASARRPPLGPWAQRSLGLLSIGAIAVCWWRAI